MSSSTAGLLYIVPYLSDKIHDIFSYLFSRYQVKGICIPPGMGKTTLVSSLSSESTLLIDLDPELRASFSSEEQDKLSQSNSSNLGNRLLYSKSREVLEQILEMVNSTSKSIKKILLVSSDYRLLKYIKVSSISYFCPSRNLIAKVKINGVPDSFESMRQDLIERKSSKLVTYNSFEELQSQVIDLFGVGNRL